MKVRSLGLCGPAGAGSLPAPSGVREGIQSAATLSQDHHAGKTRRMGARRSGYLKRSRAAVSVQQTSPSEKNTGGRRVMQEVKRCCTRTQTCVVSEPPVTHLPAEQESMGTSGSCGGSQNSDKFRRTSRSQPESELCPIESERPSAHISYQDSGASGPM